MLDNLVCVPLGDCGGTAPSVAGDYGGDIAAGDPAVEVGGAGPGGNDFFGCDPSDPFEVCGTCPDIDPECGGCDPAFSLCECDAILGCDYWPKVGWAHYLSLLAGLAATARCIVGERSSTAHYPTLCNDGDTFIEEWSCPGGCSVADCRAGQTEYTLECHKRGPKYYALCSTVYTYFGKALFCDCCRQK